MAGVAAADAVDVATEQGTVADGHNYLGTARQRGVESGDSRSIGMHWGIPCCKGLGAEGSGAFLRDSFQ